MGAKSGFDWWALAVGGLLATVLLALAPSPVGADIYMYRDANGVLHFTNVPASAEYRLYIRSSRPRFRASPATKKFDGLIQDAARRYGVDFSLLKAIIRAESSFDPQAISRKGARGLMQIMPQNFQSLDIQDPFDPKQNIMGGTRYFRSLLDRYQGKVALTLAAYNAGPTAVDRYRRIPPYAETQDYVEKVLRYYKHYKNNT
ncbi:MAG: lytic transglycosylase domain-containing protein [Desulfobacterales bacterium]|nr:lytic transglycosylase domain-containing protein [Desulfobacterales bacterium]MDJ0854016.1 lytic transglycosylase domain-containing protein [Desulfobacterales bacterium]MDJ0886836.1 lytic transglycosylase domain-containing protein [Desulfobacterales bacterium]MDJ0988622.1 lytic transglycosylase domain-containing protein [Desulfobacterales bacterium]